MSLADDYKRQFGWRSWPTVLDALPALAGQSVLDLGCAVGDQAAALVARGARVIGVDANEELIRAAQSRQLANAEFRQADLLMLPDFGAQVDGIWCSFTAAYFPDLPSALRAWAKHLRTGGWVTLTEIDDLFGHVPLGAMATSLLASYAQDALRAGRYDFQMGRKLATHTQRAGLTVHTVLTLEDHELAFSGPAQQEVVDAWRTRFDRMKLLHDFCGSDFAHVRDEFLRCLISAEHRSLAKVYCCIATK